MPTAVLRDIDAVQILACGTSYYAGLTARYWIEAIAGIPCAVEIASEYRYRDAVPNPKQLVVTISQSGETARHDGGAEVRQVARPRAHAVDLQRAGKRDPARQRDCVYYTRAGAEIGVASTKAFTTQLVALFLLTCDAGASCAAG